MTRYAHINLVDPQGMTVKIRGTTAAEVAKALVRDGYYKHTSDWLGLDLYIMASGVAWIEEVELPD